MIPVKLNLSNFTSYGENVPELDFTKFHLAAISGLNGAGKSSLLDSITWCLWGSSRLGDNSDQLVRSGQNLMFVEFSFELDNHIFTVKRQRSLKSGGTTSLEFYSSKNNLTEGTIKSTQQKIIDTLHLTYETFINSAYLRQGHADEFTTKGPTERKKILADILGLSHYDLLEEKAKEKVKEIQNKLVSLEYALLEIEAELSQKEERSEKKKIAEEKVLDLEKQIKNLDATLKILRQEKEILNLNSEERKKLEQNYQQNKKELDEIIFSGKSRKEIIENLKKELQSLDGIEEKLQELKNLLEEKENQDKARQQKLETEKNISDVKRIIDLRKQQQENLEKEINKLKLQITDSTKVGAKCPTCLQEIGKEEKVHVHQELKKQIEILEKELLKINFSAEEKTYQSLETTLKSLIFDPEKYLKLSQKILDLEKLQIQKEKKIQLQATLQTEEKVVLEMRVLFQNKKILVDKLEMEISKLPDLSEKLNHVTQETRETEEKIDVLRSQEKEAQGLLGQMTELISRTAQFEKNKTEQTEKKINLQKEKGIYEELSLAFGKKGIQAMIIETAIPEIEEETNKLLEKLTDGRMKISLETQRETKGKIAGTSEKGIVETLDIIISDEMGERPYEGYSGGEQFRVNFAIRLALSKLLTQRAGSKLQFLVIDEGFGTQDAQGRGRIVEALNIIKNDFAKILVITHLEELKDEFPVRIEVSKSPSGSTFKVVGI
ncbi:MAG: SMC family ATPase [Candidatus Daviesbacteria bacterium]|nr:SMC family ATPase [Candidatus Daviesbacteria bacterium]